MKFSEELMVAMQVKRLRMRAIDLTQREVLEANLAWMFHVIKASENLLRVGHAVARDRMLKEYYLRKLKEEDGHAIWLQNDLITAGVKHDVIPRAAVTMAGTQYYMLYHISPTSLLGYMAALECFPAPIEQILLLESFHGTDLLRTSRYHAEHDKEHGRELLDFIDARVVPHERPAVMEAATMACEVLAAATMQMEC